MRINVTDEQYLAFEQSVPSSFKSDGCTAWPDRWWLLTWLIRGWKKQYGKWRPACRTHDWLYQDGRLENYYIAKFLPGLAIDGTEKRPLTRREADAIIYAGVRYYNGGYRLTAFTMWNGVRAMGWVAWRNNGKRLGIA